MALQNLFIFTSLFIAGCMVIGLLLAILLDQRIRAEGVIRTIYLYPMALSFIVTGTAWKWILNPTPRASSKSCRSWGFPDFSFDWLVDPHMAIYTVVIAGVWQSSGYVMALFLAGLRSVDDEIIKAAAIDGAGPLRTYPAHRPADRPAGVPLLVHHPRAPRHQELRPGHGADRRRAGLCHRHAGDLHVFLRLPAQRTRASPPPAP